MRIGTHIVARSDNQFGSLQLLFDVTDARRLQRVQAIPALDRRRVACQLAEAGDAVDFAAHVPVLRQQFGRRDHFAQNCARAEQPYW